MSEQTPYINRNPGDLITSQDWNGMQEMIRADIASQIATAVAGIKTVDQSHDAERLGGQTPADLAQQVFDYVLRQLPKRTGYLNVFKKLQVGTEAVIDHQLGAAPLVDVYNLDYFRVVASEDGHVFQAWATFFLYHGSESTIRFRPEEAAQGAGQGSISVPIDPAGHPYRIPFTQMLELYQVEVHDDSTLDEVETEFWKAFNAAPNDRFDDDQIYHSPWFDRCCGDNRTWRSLIRDRDDIYLQMRPRKTVNYPVPPPPNVENNVPDPTRAPTNIQVTHFDLNSVGLTLLIPPEIPNTTLDPPAPPRPKPDHIKLLVLLKV